MRRGSGEAGWTVRGAVQAPNGRSPGGGADHVRDADELAAVRRHCWRNPVKYGLAAAPEDWPWSSVHRAPRAGRGGPAVGCVVPIHHPAPAGYAPLVPTALVGCVISRTVDVWRGAGCLGSDTG